MTREVEIDDIALERALDDVVKPDLKRRAHNVRDAAEARAPKRTGRLASSIGVEEDGDGFLIGTTVAYADENEFGTSEMDPQPFLRPALDAGGD